MEEDDEQVLIPLRSGQDYENIVDAICNMIVKS